MKKKLFMVGLLLILSIVCLLTASAALEDTTPDVSIDFVNLSYSDSVYIKYAVSAKNVTPDGVRLLVWREADTDGYAYGTQDEIILPAYLDTIEGEQYIIFDYKNIAAKEMGDDIYVRAMIEVDETVYTSAPLKYSVLRYAYDTIHDETADDVLKELMQDMLAYGSTAQKLFDYKATTPAYNKSTKTIDWCDIAVVNGTLADGFKNGLVYQNAEITLIANQAPKGQVFSHWEDSHGNIIGTDMICTATAERDTGYTAIYLSYKINAPYAVITGFGTNEGIAAYIPEKINQNTVYYINSYAFSETAISSVHIPATVGSIGFRAFYECKNLKAVYIESIEKWLNIKFESSTNPLYNGADLYLNGNLVTDIVVPNTVTSIPDNVFDGCKSITNIIIPDSVKSVGNRAFSHCTKLSSVSIGDGVTSIGDAAFSSCTSLTNISLGNNVQSIGYAAFQFCSNLKSIHIPESLQTIKSVAFGAVQLQAVYITNIESWLCISFGDSSANPISYADFYLNGVLVTEIKIPDTIKSINSFAFYNCRTLTSVEIPISVTRIGKEAFSGCSNLTSINIPDGITNIEASTFSGCSNLTSITIPDSVSSIGEQAFINCTSLTSINIPNGITSIEANTFQYCNSLTSITIPDSVASIGDYAFRNCTSLASITIPNSVAKIGYSAFQGCTNLATVIIGNGVARIGAYTFESCTSLTNLTIGNGVTIIDDHAFSNCASLTKLELPNGVTTIGTYAFSSCNLTSIIIPVSITSLGVEAFSRNWGLTSITYLGTIDNWNSISKGARWDQYTGAYIIYCNDGEI